MDTLMVEYRWTRAEFLRAMRQSVRLTRGDALYFMITLVVAALVHLLLFVICLDVALWTLGSYLVRPIVAWKRIPGIDEPRRAIFSEEGIITSSPSKSASVKWSSFSTSRETSDYYIIIRKKSSVGSPFKKTIFATSSDEAAFRSLLRKKTKASLRDSPALDGPASESGG